MLSPELQKLELFRSIMPEPAVTTSALSACGSAPHRAVLGLLPVALGYPVPEGLLADLAVSAPEDLVAISTAHYVHTVLASAFENAPELRAAIPRDLDVFFAEMQAANLQRNERFRHQLKVIGERLAEHGIEAVVLKGGAELIAPIHKNPAFRFLSDLDLLVREADIEAACDALAGLGEMVKYHEVNQRGHHHLPPIMAPDWVGPLELHRRIGTGMMDRVLPAIEVIQASQPSQFVGIRIPSQIHRFAHLVLHAQFAGARYQTHQVSPRDCLEVQQMSVTFSKEVQKATRAPFEAHAISPVFDALRNVTACVFEQDHHLRQKAADSWGTQALKGFGHPKRRRFVDTAKYAFWYLWQFMTNPERRSHYLKLIRDPEERQLFWSFHRNRAQRIR